MPVALKPDGELIIHGRGSARYAVELPVADDYGVEFAIWDTTGATEGVLAHLSVGPETLFSEARRDFHHWRDVNITDVLLEQNTPEIYIHAGPNDAWFIFLRGPDLRPRGEPVLDPLAPPYAPRGDISYTDGGRRLAFLYSENPEAVRQIRALAWATDGLDSMPSPEHEAAYYLSDIAWVDAELLNELLRQEWLLDGVTWNEAFTIGRLSHIGQAAPPSAIRLLGMPFMQSFEPLDGRALSALGFLAQQGRLQEVLEHSTLRDGITDEQTDLVSQMYQSELGTPGFELQLLDERQTIAVRRTVDLPLQGPTPFSVIWSGGGGTVEKANVSMDLLIDIVRTFEEFMGVPYPQPYGILLVADVTPAAGGGGGNGYATVDPPYYDEAWIVAHEVSHTYWKFSPSWIAEGGATFMEHYYTSTRAGRPLPQPYGCAQFTNIAALVASDPTHDNICNYNLGAGLFLDLYHTLGDGAFREAYGRLFTWLEDEALAVRCGRLEGKGHCYVHASFVEYLPEHADVAARILQKHYYGR